MLRHERGEKNWVTKDEYPDTIYPPFALGGSLAYPATSVRLLYEASLRVKSLWLDDVYITGICAPKVGVALMTERHFRFRHIGTSVKGKEDNF